MRQGVPVQIWYSNTAASSHPPPHIQEVLPETNPEDWVQQPVPTTAPAAEPDVGPSPFTPVNIA
eukprot:1152113-Prorocentrum_lima.AAC.1